MSKQNDFFNTFANFVVEKRIWLSLSAIMLAMLVYAGIPNLRLDTDGRVFMGPGNPDKQTLDLFEQEFAKDDNLNILFVPKDGNIFSPKNLKIIDSLTDDAWNLPYVRLVNSITRFQNSYSDDDMLIVEDLISEPHSISELEAREAKIIAQSRVEINGALINEDASISAVSIIFRLPGLDLASEIPTIMAEANPLIEKYRTNYPDISFYITGSVPIEKLLQRLAKDGQSLTPAMLIAMLLIVGFC